MWWLGFTIDRGKLLLLVLVLFPTLVALSYHAGFEPTFQWREDVLDAMVAYGVGFCASFVVLTLLGVLRLDSAMSDAFGSAGRLCARLLDAPREFGVWRQSW